MKLTPRSMARWRAARVVVSSVEPQSLPPIAQAPKPMAEIFQPVRPKVRYSIAPPCLLSSANAAFSVALSGSGNGGALEAVGTGGTDGTGVCGGVAGATACSGSLETLETLATGVSGEGVPVGA